MATAQEHSRWTAAASADAASSTYASIRRALQDIEREFDVEIFLQGSYANSTNIRDDSDVDVVVMTRLTFHGARERLGAQARARFDALPPATFRAPDLRREVTAALVSYYGAARVHPRNKCIKVDKTSGYVDSDTVPSLQYRWYRSADSDLYSDFIEGIAIHPADGSGTIINFPKVHIANGEAKNQQCSDRYKATVRQMKRLRNRAVDGGLLEGGVAPGYLLECMTFNVPADQFVYDDSQRLSSIVLWLKYANKDEFLSCDGIHHLFRTDPGNFDTPTAQRIIDALWEAY